MARIPGIQIEKDSKGRPAYARINLKKHKEFLQPLEQIGAVDEDKFEQMWKKGLSPSEARAKAHEILKQRIDAINL